MSKKLLISMTVFSLALGGTAFAKGSAKEGKKVYKQNCALCHGAKGAGDGPGAAGLNPKPANFAKGVFKYGSKDADLAKIIKLGKGMMPAWGSVLKPADVDNVIAYIRTLKK